MAAYKKLPGCLGDGQLLPRATQRSPTGRTCWSLPCSLSHTRHVPFLCFAASAPCSCQGLCFPFLGFKQISRKNHHAPQPKSLHMALVQIGHSGFGIHWLPTGKQAPSTLFGELGTWFCRRWRVSACRGRERGWDG